MSFNHEGQTNGGKRNGKNILEGVGGRIAGYDQYERYGKPSMAAQEARDAKQSKRWAKAHRKAKRDAHYTSVPKNLTDAEKVQNAKYWQSVHQLLGTGLSLTEAKAKTKCKPVVRREEYQQKGRRFR